MSVPGFSGFSLGTKIAAAKKPLVVQSSLLPSSTSKDSSTKDVPKENQLKSITEVAQIPMKRDDFEAINKALEEDPTAFDYDDIYEEMQPQLINKKKLQGNARYGYGITVKSTSKENSNSNRPQAQYIQNLLAKAKDREIEKELVLERRIHRENEKYEAQFGETESFITPEYKAKLEADKRKRELENEREAQSGISSQSMASFYTNLSRNTIASGSMIQEETNNDKPDNEQIQSKETLEKEKNIIRQADSQDSSYQDDNKDSETDEKSQIEQDEIQSPNKRSSAQKQQVSAINQRKERRNTEQDIQAAKERYLERRRERIKSGRPS